MNLEHIQRKIYEIRGFKVILDFDLAYMYGVETRILNQAVKRNIKRFPSDFMFQPTKDKWESISSQFVMTSRAKRPKFLNFSKNYWSIKKNSRNHATQSDLEQAQTVKYKKSTNFLCFFLQGKRDSNSHQRFWRPLFYP